jgi:hypothetical protein
MKSGRGWKLALYFADVDYLVLVKFKECMIL